MDTITRWNEAEGLIWATEADRFDRISEEQLEPLLRAAGLRRGSCVLDVGCGAGATTLAAAWTCGPDGTATGVDISAPLLAVARNRAEPLANVSFHEADAARDDLGSRRYDAVISRSTVMFFDEPAGALANIRAALRPAGRLAFTVWREAERNGWSSIPAAVIARHLPQPGGAKPPARLPGAFALADRADVLAVVVGAGFEDVEIEALDHGSHVGRDVDDALAFFDRVAGRALRTVAPPHVLDQIEADLRDRLAEHLTPMGVVVPASAWLVSARNPETR
jgi:SAM-dependent methyltransferase